MEAPLSDLQHLDDTPVPPPAVRCAPRRHSWPVRLYRRLQIRFLLWRERCSREEREAYAAQGVPLGRAYLSNCMEFESEMRGKAALLEVGL